MNRLIAAFAVGAFALAGTSIQAAEEPVQSGTAPGAEQAPGGTNDPGSAEKQHEHTQGGVQSGASPAGATPGRQNDPCSAEGGTGAAGGEIKCNPEESAGQPGRANDPGTAERRK